MKSAANSDVMSIVGQLIRQLQPDRGPAPMLPMLIVEEVRTRPWTSATFAGERHQVDMLLRGPAVELSEILDRLMMRLQADDWTFDLPGAIVAELRLARLSVHPDPTRADIAVMFEILTVVD